MSGAVLAILVLMITLAPLMVMPGLVVLDLAVLMSRRVRAGSRRSRGLASMASCGAGAVGTGSTCPAGTDAGAVEPAVARVRPSPLTSLIAASVIGLIGAGVSHPL
ncbi:MAG: hypothetical protein JOZ09_17575 [Pseudonocardiales bacterium]|nr:hypothetical protein [Pseudonocardiales bacterium]